MSFKVWDALEVSMTASTDVSLHPGNGEDADILIRTHRAMFQSKLLGDNCASHYEQGSYALACA